MQSKSVARIIELEDKNSQNERAVNAVLKKYFRVKGQKQFQ